MAFFKKVKTAKNIEGGHTDTLGGVPITSNAYLVKLLSFYGYQNDGGSMGVSIEAEIVSLADGGETPLKGRKLFTRETVTNSNQEIFYERDGKKHYLAGYLLADAVALAATNGELGLFDLEEEDKYIKIKKDNKEVDKEVPMFTETIGQHIVIGAVRSNKWKTALGDNGKYHETDESYATPVWDHIFTEDGFTITELENEAEEPEFIHEWLEKWEGKERALPKKKEAPTSSRSGSRSRSSTTERSGARQRRGFIK